MRRFLGTKTRSKRSFVMYEIPINRSETPSQLEKDLIRLANRDELTWQRTDKHFRVFYPSYRSTPSFTFIFKTPSHSPYSPWLDYKGIKIRAQKKIIRG
jgi:hypothetical protein